jgi:exopolyphosphatase/guanosine-5'-triphosphate,3'-diphosphate pyrophosphatase
VSATARERQEPQRRGGAGNSPTSSRPPERFAALDLGTNNCRLLIAVPRGRSFRVIDAYSRIVRLGEGVSNSGRLSDAAMGRAIEALRICADKIQRRGVTSKRLIATEACRAAANGDEFLSRVRVETGLEFEIISTAEEARLAVRGCSDLLDPNAQAAMIFDIGGGSTELSWVAPKPDAAPETLAWTSLPIGVVTLSERWGGREIDQSTYEKIVESVRETLRAFGDPAGLKGHFERRAAHLLGTSGTVTSIAGVHLELPRYERTAVDGLWLSAEQVRSVTQRLCGMNFAARSAEPCIGVERADLVVCGCAILDALLREWPSDRIRVGDRGLREGMLADLVDRARRQRRRRRRRRKSLSGQVPRI